MKEKIDSTMKFRFREFVKSHLLRANVKFPVIYIKHAQQSTSKSIEHTQKMCWEKPKKHKSEEFSASLDLLFSILVQLNRKASGRLPDEEKHILINHHKTPRRRKQTENFQELPLSG